MKKRVFAALLCLALMASLVPAAFAAGLYADVTDPETARNAEVLRLMGVMEGDGSGRFHPNSSLTRAEFCKMAVVLSGKRSVVTRYASRTVFPDLRAPHWATGYVNYAASADAGLIHGMPDGTFQPDRAITYGEAVAILMRRLGYTDKDTGGIWPDGYIALAGEAGMTKGLTISGNASITRAQAAKLFVNALTAENDEGKSLLDTLGYTCDTTGDPITIWGVDMVNGKLRLSSGDPIEMENPMELFALIGVKGYVVTKDKKAVTFLPVVSNAGNAVSDAAIIVSANGSAAGFDALTGGATNYTVYRNGVRATVSALKKGDVVTYNAANNTIQACDTRVAVYYENCEPSPAAPTSITVLGGTEFKVMTTAQRSLAQLKPGKNMIIQLTADGRVAGAVESGSANGLNGNALGFVDGKGKASLICANTLIELAGSYSDYAGQAVRVSQSSKTVYLYKQSSSNTGALDLTAKTLGTRKLADGVLVFSDGKLTAVEALGTAVIEQSRIAYARTNAANEVDLIVIADSGNELFGRVIITKENDTWIWNEGYGDKEPKNDSTGAYLTDEDTGAFILDEYNEKIWEWAVGHGPRYTEKNSTTGYYTQKQFITVVKSETIKYGPFESYYSVHTGDFVSTQINSSETNFTNMVPLTKLPSVPASAWIGDTAVNYGGQTYTVPSGVICWNRDAGDWFADLAAAKAYGGTMDLYVKDGVVRVIEVRA